MDDFDLDAWQAHSHSELANKPAEELFSADFAVKYCRLHADIWYHMIRLHGTICALETIRDFPFEYIYGPDEMEFWHLVTENFWDTATLLLHNLAVDQGRDVHSLPSFKTLCFEAQWTDSTLRETFQQTLRQIDFDKHIKAIGPKITAIRHEQIAHRLKCKETGLPIAVAHVSLSELKYLYRVTHALFGTLTFGFACPTLTGDMMPLLADGAQLRSSLDCVLDAVARDSEFVNRPERKKEWWTQIKSLMTSQDLCVLNDLRKRIGLHEV